MRKKYKEHVRRYLGRNTNWHIGRDEHLETDIELEFGRFFICIKRGVQVLRVPLIKIEQA